jgi:hypothetical protein
MLGIVWLIMQEQQVISPTITVSWTVLAAMCGCFSVVVGIATAYLKLFIGEKLSTFEKTILAQIRVEFARRDLTDKELADIKGDIHEIKEDLGKIWDELRPVQKR